MANSVATRDDAALAVLSRPKVPLAWANRMFAELCERLDSGEDVTAALETVCKETRLARAEAIDRRLTFHDIVLAERARLAAVRDAYADEVRRADRVIEAFKADTKAILAETPDLPFKGTLGAISLQKSPPAVEIDLGGKDLTPETIEFFGIDERFVVVRTTYSLDTAAVKDALKAGETLAWARLTQGEHVRFRK